MGVGVTPGGTWTYNGFNSSTQAGPFGAGGTTPPTLVGDNPELNFNGYIVGFYSFTYDVEEGECEDTSPPLIIQIIRKVCTPENVNLEFCEGESGVINAYTALGVTFTTICFIPNPGGLLSVGADVVDPSDINMTDRTIDMTGYVPGNYAIQVNFIKSGESPQFDLDCVGCVITHQATINITITDCEDPCEEVSAGDPVNLTICN